MSTPDLSSRQSFELKVVPIRPLVYRDQRLKIHGPADAAGLWEDEIATNPEYEPTVEWLAAIFLDAARGLIGFRIIAKGGNNCVYAGVKDIFVPAGLAGAEMVILAHNHPHGDITPSDADIRCSQRMLLAAGFFEVALEDFLIIGLPSSQDSLAFTSLRELGHLQKLDVAAIQLPPADTSGLAGIPEGEPDLRAAVMLAAVKRDQSVSEFLSEFLLTELRKKFLHGGLLEMAPSAAVARSAGSRSSDEPPAPTNAS